MKRLALIAISAMFLSDTAVAEETRPGDATNAGPSTTTVVPVPKQSQPATEFATAPEVGEANKGRNKPKSQEGDPKTPASPPGSGTAK